MDSAPSLVARVRRIWAQPIVRIVTLSLFVVAIAVGACGLQGQSPTTTIAPRIGGPAPAFTLEDATGKNISLTNSHGHPVIINFWATWCPPCKAEMPAISMVARAHPNAVVLAVDVLEGPVLVRDYVGALSLGFTPLLDPTGTVTGRYSVNLLPTSFFLSADGAIRAINVGPMDSNAIEQDLLRASS